MAWNPIRKLKEKITGVPAPEAPAEGAAALGLPGAPDLKELEKKGMLGKFFRHWKNPAFMKQVQALAARMQAEGVNVKDPKAIEAWVTAHQKELESGTAAAPGAAAPKPETFVKSGPEVGRNDPCPCGSGKKFKKCCGAGA